MVSTTVVKRPEMVHSHWKRHYGLLLHSEYYVIIHLGNVEKIKTTNIFSLGNVRFYSIHGGRRTHIESSWIQQCRISNVPTDTQ